MQVRNPEIRPSDPKELGTDGEKREQCWNVHGARKEAHCAAEAVSTEPPQHLLCAMSEENHVKGQAEDDCHIVILGGN